MDRDENRRTEYEECFDNWRFLVGLRFTVLAFFLTLTSGLVYIALTVRVIGDNRTYQFVLTIAGLTSCYLNGLLEGRNRQLYNECLQRAKNIEKTWHSHIQGQGANAAAGVLAHRIDGAPKSVFLFRWHTAGIVGFYVMAALVWVLLLIAAMGQRFPLACPQN